jgi:hypothetical protein
MATAFGPGLDDGHGAPEASARLRRRREHNRPSPGGRGEIGRVDAGGRGVLFGTGSDGGPDETRENAGHNG